MTGLVIGLALFAAVAVSPPPPGLSAEAWWVAATAMLMAVWWITEPIPVAATALLPVALFPLTGVTTVAETTAPYANPLIFLFLGGFMMALAMQKCGLHRRIALAVLRRSGGGPAALIGAFMAATAFLSMWVSNTATTVMMLPIGLSVIHLTTGTDGRDGREITAASPFARALLLGIAYSATIGGLATLIGTPPNALLAAFMAERYGIEIGFAQWMAIGLPLSISMLAAAWLVLTHGLRWVGDEGMTDARGAIDAAYAALGPVSAAERRVAALFILAGIGWMTRPLIAPVLPGLSDAGIAMLVALSLFVVPTRGWRGPALVDWGIARDLPWGVLLLFGGGLSLAAAIQGSGLAAWIGAGFQAVGHWPPIALVVLVAALILFLTEITSNTATAATFLPLAAALATATGVAPWFYVVPAALAASCAFMMPVATPPNAIVYGSGWLTVAQMARAGIWLNLIAVVAITATSYVIVGRVLVSGAP